MEALVTGVLLVAGVVGLLWAGWRLGPRLDDPDLTAAIRRQERAKAALTRATERSR